MLIIWDEPKRKATASFDLDTALERPARPSRTGRPRLLLIGVWDGAVVVAGVVSPLGAEAISLVSLRHASQAERGLFARS